LFGLFSAYGLHSACPLNCCLFLLGPHDTGKSTLTGGISAVHGDELTGDLKLEQICIPRAKLSDISWLDSLETTMINIAGEVDQRTIDDSSNFKSTTAGEVIIGRGFREAGGKIWPVAKLWFVMNDTPIWNGREEITDRVRLLAFNEVTPSWAKKENVEETIRAEKNGIFRWMLTYANEMLELDVMPHGGVESRKRYAEFCKNTDPYGDFSREYARVGKAFRVEPRHLQWAIRDYITRHDSNESLRRAFLGTLKKRYNISEKRHERVGDREADQRKWFQYGLELTGALWEDCKWRNDERLKNAWRESE
jgi:phage/plasmid-associated DNA primase